MNDNYRGIHCAVYKKRIDDSNKWGSLTACNFKSRQDAIDFILHYGSVGDECLVDDSNNKLNHFGGHICSNNHVKYIETYFPVSNFKYYSSAYLKKCLGGKK